MIQEAFEFDEISLIEECPVKETGKKKTLADGEETARILELAADAFNTTVELVLNDRSNCLPILAKMILSHAFVKRSKKSLKFVSRLFNVELLNVLPLCEQGERLLISNDPRAKIVFDTVEFVEDQREEPAISKSRLGQIMNLARSMFNTTAGEIRSGSRRQDASDARAPLALALKELGMKPNDIQGFLRQRSQPQMLFARGRRLVTQDSRAREFFKRVVGE